jgi:serine/threonine protein kinase
MFYRGRPASKKFGDYYSISVLAQSNFGIVYKGKHSITNRNVAIKVLHAHINSSHERERFFNEAKILDRLEHPYILKLLHVGIEQDEDLPYLITEYAPKGSLRDRLRQPLSLDESLLILSQIGEALTYAHHNGIVHRDIKPENILFGADGKVRLADFGISIIIEKTTKADASGTPGYMAPEQGSNVATKRNDQYSLAVVARELFTGHRPSQLIDPPISLSQLPFNIEQAIQKATSRNYEDRYEDIQTFMAVLLKSKEQWYLEGSAAYKAGQYEEAVFDFEQAIKFDPNYDDAYNDKGRALWILKRYEDAYLAFDKAIQINPHMDAYYYNIGMCLRRLSNEKALEGFAEAIKLRPTYHEAYYEQGNTLVALNRYQEALVAYEKASELEPEKEDYQRSKDEVIYHLRKTGEIQPTFIGYIAGLLAIKNFTYLFVALFLIILILVFIYSMYMTLISYILNMLGDIVVSTFFAMSIAWLIYFVYRKVRSKL